MRAKYSIYKGITIYHDSDLSQYSCTYKKYYFASDNIKKVQDCIDIVLSYEKVLTKRAIDTNQK